MTDDIKYYKDGRNFVLEASGLFVPEGHLMLTLQDAETGKIKSVDYVKNMVVDVGRYALADALRGTETNSRGIITWCAVGTSAVAPARADTGLTTEIFRKLISVRSWGGAATSTFQTFFTTSEANGSLREAGLFGDTASSIPGSGVLFSKLAINRTKTSSDTLTLSWDITVGG